MANTAAASTTADDIIRLERDALDRWGRGDPGGFLEVYGADVTYFDPLVALRIDGRPAMTDYYRRPSDQVVGQVLRYMGWVKKNLCAEGQTVRGLVICRDPDPKLSYALEMTNNIDVRYYSVSFKLSETPQQ